MDATLVLDCSGTALHIIPWQRAVILMYLERAYPLQVTDVPIYVPDQQTFGFTSRDSGLRRPTVIQLTRYVGYVKYNPGVTLRNLRIRDDDTCQYCERRLTYSEMTMDHVLPRSRGGPKTWTNIVLACSRCNVQKRDRTPEEARMRLLRQPFQPKTPLVLAKYLEQLTGKRCG